VVESHGSEVLVDRVGAVATVTLNRPERYNAFTTSLRAQLRAALEDLAAAEEVRAVVLTGAGKAFCSGQDLTEFAAVVDVARTLREGYNPIIELLTTMGKPVVAAINGPCVGAGLGLALACDLRVMADEGFLSCAFIGIGLVPDSGTTSFLTRAVGYERAFELAATGRRVPAAEALALGLVLETCPAGAVHERASALARALAAGPTRAIGLTKALLHEAEDATLGTMLEREAVVQGDALATEDHREGVAAFLAKRPPVFRGR
jgi:2-(1,2-epoxy-1,2-dihydrophenyl)acetyl-CoA isomerase